MLVLMIDDGHNSNEKSVHMLVVVSYLSLSPTIYYPNDYDYHTMSAYFILPGWNSDNMLRPIQSQT